MVCCADVGTLQASVHRTGPMGGLSRLSRHSRSNDAEHFSKKRVRELTYGRNSRIRVLPLPSIRPPCPHPPPLRRSHASADSPPDMTLGETARHR